jgi:cytochrome c-type biogenesis protein CcmH/NrfG
MKVMLAVVLVSVFAFAQTHQHAPALAQSKIDLATLPRPERIDGVGRSQIPITTKSAEAQQWFDQGLALLHCFWDYEALRAFAQALRLDPDCAMCHWGVAQVLEFRGSYPEQVEEEFGRAKELSQVASDREQRYIRAYLARADEKAFAKEMEALIYRYRKS